MYHGNHFMMYVEQITMLYTLNLSSAVSQLYLNRTRRKKEIRGKKSTCVFCGLPEGS